jgi:glycosyl transferase family 2
VAHLDWADGAAKAPDKETSSPMPDRHLLSCAERVGRVAAESSGMVGIAGVRRPSDRRGRAIRARVPCRMLRDGNLHDRGSSPREWRECAPRAATFWSRPVATRPTTCGRTLDSVSAQTVLPALWVVVDDGSTDETPAILEEYRAKLPYLRVVHKADRSQRAVGPGVIDAFYAGLDTVDLDQFDYLCKLDLDLDLPPCYRGRPARSYCHGARRRSPGAGCPTLAVPGQPAPSS